MTTGFLEIQMSQWLEKFSSWNYKIGEYTGRLNHQKILAETGKHLLVISATILNSDSQARIELRLPVTILHERTTRVRLIYPDFKNLKKSLAASVSSQEHRGLCYD